jgi:sulfur-carrier protein adenylyltransferase/sulfurtransferase
LIGSYEIVADGTDNFATRYLVNDACVLTGVPNVYASVSQFSGQVSIFGAPDGPCYRCLYPEPPPPGLVPSCAEGGVLGVLPGIVGSLQAMEVVKFVTGVGKPLIGRLLLYDSLSAEFRTLALDADSECSVCGTNPTISELIDYDVFCGTSAEEVDHTESVQRPMNPLYQTCSPAELKAMMDERDDVILIDVRTEPEYEMENLGGTLLPLMDLPEKIGELNEHKNREIVVMCRSGARSAQAQTFMIQSGFENVINLAGGIIAWKNDIG